LPPVGSSAFSIFEATRCHGRMLPSPDVIGNFGVATLGFGRVAHWAAMGCLVW